jgi:lysophospholipase L1-like esterase
MHGCVNDSGRDGCHRDGECSQPRDQLQGQPPAEYAILVKPGERMRHSGCSFFRMNHHSPILRIAIACTVLAGVTACSKLGLGGSPTTPTGPPAPGSTIVYSAVGASDVTGVGSSSICLLNDCPDGTGYVQDAIRQLRAQNFTVTVRNLGIPTAVIGPDFEALGQQYNHTIVGNFIVQEMPFVQPNATLVTIFAGVNEVNTVTAALGGGAGGSDPNGYIDAQVRAFTADYVTLLNGIRDRAGAPRIIILNVPNAAGLPSLAGASSAQRSAAQRISVGMTRTSVNVLASSSVSVVDLMCDARSYVPGNYSSDGLHPNDAGYAFIASEVVRAVTTGSAYPTPQASCAAMTMVP